VFAPSNLFQPSVMNTLAQYKNLLKSSIALAHRQIWFVHNLILFMIVLCQSAFQPFLAHIHKKRIFSEQSEVEREKERKREREKERKREREKERKRERETERK
jgi:hypothetical protein